MINPAVNLDDVRRAQATLALRQSHVDLNAGLVERIEHGLVLGHHDFDFVARHPHPEPLGRVAAAIGESLVAQRRRWPSCPGPRLARRVEESHRPAEIELGDSRQLRPATRAQPAPHSAPQLDGSLGNGCRRSRCSSRTPHVRRPRVARLVLAVRRAIRLEREFAPLLSRAICVIFITLQNFFGTALEKG